MASKTKKKAKKKAKAKPKGKAKRSPSPKASKKAKKKAAPKARTAKPKRKATAKTPLHSELITIKVTPEELQMIFRQADKYAGGNVSRLLRNTARACKATLPAKAA